MNSNDPANTPDGGPPVRRELIDRLARWTYVGGTEGDVEWTLLESLNRTERTILASELERLHRQVGEMLTRLRSTDDDLYGG